MATVKHLDNAPITEAIVDFRVGAKPGLDVSVFDLLKEELSEQYPKVKEIRILEAQLPVGSAEIVTPLIKRHEAIGLRFGTSDGLDIVQFRLDGFTFNRLKPYTSWDQIFPTVMKLWSRYVTLANPSSVTRLALRYINRIELPAGIAGYDDFMTSPPPLHNAPPQRLVSFLTRVTIHDEEQKLDAHITQALETHQVENKKNWLLDIDAFRVFSERGVAVGSDEIRTTFEALRSFKNRIFFDSCTDETIAGLERLQ